LESPLDLNRGESGQGSPVIQHGLDGRPSRNVGGWAEDFLYAGSSALLLVLVHLAPDLWMISFAALVPLLWGIIRADFPARALRLGFLFGISFFTVSLINSFPFAPFATLARILGGTVLLSFFGWVVAWGRRRWGFNPLVIALLWIALELGMIRLGFTRGLLGEAGAPQSLFGGMTVLFGFLSISFLIILINTVLLVAVKTLVAPAASGTKSLFTIEQTWDVLFPAELPSLTICLNHQGRAPPISRCVDV